jgi:16S rRNA (adenine1518-N6/adenine1519-N6)-dimethyltransferase
VGNLPYNLSTPILFKLLEWQSSTGMFADATVMLQREVADRLAAKPGTKAWGALSLYLQLDTHINVPLRLPPGAFNPEPKVHSAIAHLTFQPRTVRIADQTIFDGLVRTMFSLRRKTLNNVLKSYDPAGLTALTIAGIDGQRRPETLSLKELGHLVECLATVKRAAVL